MDLYIILGIERGASVGDIKRAYKRLARKYHPDINPGDRMAAAQFRQIAEAYETLIDPDRRQRYDTTGATAQPEGPATFGFEGFDFSVAAHGAEASTFGDLFAEVLQGERPHGGPERGADLHHELTIGFDAAIAGGEYVLSITRQEHCRTCRGTGRTTILETRCPHCHGTG